MEDSMVEVRLRWLISDKDRHENTRYYVRKPGQRKIRIRETPGTDAFMEAYHAALDGKLASGQPVPPGRVPEGSLAWLCHQYYASSLFKVELGQGTQRARLNILKGLCASVGALPYNRLEDRHVHKWMDARSDRPEAANNLLKALKGLFEFAVARRLLKKNPLEGVKKITTDTEGHHTWTVAEVRQFEARHPLGTVPRLAMALLLYTGQRRSDVVLMGRQHVEDGVMRIRRQKTKKTDDGPSFLPVLPQLQEVLDVSPLGDLTFIVTKFNRPFSAAGFGNAFRQWCDEAGLPHCTAHGLRKAGATIAAENGATDRQLMAIFGWKKAEMATLYTRAAEQKKLAKEGMGMLVPREDRARKA